MNIINFISKQRFSSEGCILALDLGERRIGVAISDEKQIIIKPLITLVRSNRDKDIATITALAKTNKVKLIVIGLPENIDGTFTLIGKKALVFGRRLNRVAGFEIAYIDEFETTKEANLTMIAINISKTRRYQLIDKLAAAFILRRFLEERYMKHI